MIYIGVSCRVAKHKHDGVAAQKHLADVAVLVYRLRLLLTLPCFGLLCPHFLDIGQYPVQFKWGANRIYIQADKSAKRIVKPFHSKPSCELVGFLLLATCTCLIRTTGECE